MKTSRGKTRRGRPSTGKALSAAERMQRYRARRSADGLKAVTSWVPRVAPPHSLHRLHDARSLAMHAVIARRIDRDPSLLGVALANLDRWKVQRQGLLPPALAEWEAILARPWPEIATLLCEQSERAVRLRQSTPFAGVLTPAERRRIHDAFRT